MNSADKLITSMNKLVGFKDTLFRFDDLPDHEIVSTGSLSLDTALGVGGVPNNRVIEIAGPPGAGKTTLALQIMKNALIKYPESIALYLDLEGRLDKDWLSAHVPKKLKERIVFAWPDNAEQAVDIVERWIPESEGQISVVIWDSIGGAPSKGIIEKTATIGSFGGNSKVITRLSTAISPLTNKWRCIFIGINQVRDQIGAKYPTLVSPGGHAWTHACSAKIWLKPESGIEAKVFEKIQGQDVQVGYRIKALVTKCSFAAPHKSANYWFYNVPCSLGFGIDTVEETVRLATALDVIHQGGAWFSHSGLPDGKVQGLKKLTEAIKSDEKLKDRIISETRSAILAADDISGIVDTFVEEDLYSIFNESTPSLLTTQLYPESDES